MTDNERLAVLETKVNTLSEQHGELSKTLNEALGILRRQESELTRYKGFLGGVTFLASAMWAAVLMLKDYFISLGAR